MAPRERLKKFDATEVDNFRRIIREQKKAPEPTDGVAVANPTIDTLLAKLVGRAHRREAQQEGGLYDQLKECPEATIRSFIEEEDRRAEKGGWRRPYRVTAGCSSPAKFQEHAETYGLGDFNPRRR